LATANVIHDGSDEVLGEALLKANLVWTKGLEEQVESGINHQVSLFLWTNMVILVLLLVYCAKASKSDRDEGLINCLQRRSLRSQQKNGTSGKPSSLSAGRNTEYRNSHPTVKPTESNEISLPIWLHQRMVLFWTSFMGSGSTGKAALLEGFNFIGIERRKKEYL
jgi:site-specific DNA-methyltransferase (adenine-specific)